MNIARFTLPASLAAAFHVALFSFAGNYLPPIKQPQPAPTTVIREVRLEEPPPQQLDPGEKNDVKPLAGEPAPMELPDPVVPVKATDFTVPKPEPIPGPQSDVANLPRQIGVPDGSADGNPNLRTPGFIPIDQLDRTPRAKVQTSPVYPSTLKGQGIEGSVEVEFEVDVTGRVISARVLKSTEREFNAATIQAVMKWRFEPGKRDGRAVPFRMVVPVNFSLNAE